MIYIVLIQLLDLITINLMSSFNSVRSNSIKFDRRFTRVESAHVEQILVSI